jgi:hypothetical protein
VRIEQRNNENSTQDHIDNRFACITIHTNFNMEIYFININYEFWHTHDLFFPILDK